jgi:hypothetical protein
MTPDISAIEARVKAVSDKHVLVVGGYGVWCGERTGCRTYFDGFNPPICQANPEYGWITETLAEHFARHLLLEANDQLAQQLREAEERAELLEIALESANSEVALEWASLHQRQYDFKHHVGVTYPLTCQECHRTPPQFGKKLAARAALATHALDAGEETNG